MGSPDNRKTSSPAMGPVLPPEWRRYRDGFAVLQHAENLTAEGGLPAVDIGRLGRDLGLPPHECSAIVEYLVWNRYLRYQQSGLSVGITPEGSEYLQATAGRRRSARPAQARPRSAAMLPTPSARWGNRFQRDLGPVSRPGGEGESRTGNAAVSGGRPRGGVRERAGRYLSRARCWARTRRLAVRRAWSLPQARRIPLPFPPLSHLSIS